MITCSLFTRHTLLVLLSLWLVACSGNPQLEPTPDNTLEPESIIPTSTSSAPTAEPSPLPTAVSTLISLEESKKAIINTDDFERFGVSGSFNNAKVAYQAGIRFRHLFTWAFQEITDFEDDVTYWQMLRVGDKNVPWDWDRLNQVIKANPGSYWMIGNEPDVRWQDNVTPQQYAERYHEAYTNIKAADPTAQIVAGSISQGTPLRLEWLDEVLRIYQETYGEPFPADLWSLHAYTLREERDSWGVDIPPGLETDTGELYEIEDHDDLEFFKQNMLAFRRWMADNGYDVPLAVTEFGILLPFDYGFPPEDVAQYMHDSLDILLTMEDESGYSQDDNRVAQFWFWYIIEDDKTYHSGSLYDSKSGEPTLLGEAWIDYLVSIPE